MGSCDVVTEWNKKTYKCLNIPVYLELYRLPQQGTWNENQNFDKVQNSDVM